MVFSRWLGALLLALLAACAKVPGVYVYEKDGQAKATVPQPASKIAQRAVDQADQYIKTGRTGQPEKQSVDCVLVNPDNAKSVTNFTVAGS